MKCFLTLLLLSVSYFAEAKIAVLTLAVGEKYKEAVSLGVENKRQYCEKHGYDFIYGDASLDESRVPAWSKILLIQEALTKDYDWIFWTDGDSLIMDFDRPLESFIDSNYDFIINSEFSIVCSGEFFLKNCDWSRDFMRQVYTHKCPEHPWEQTAINIELDNSPEVRAHTKIFRGREINAFNPENYGAADPSICYMPGDFVIHFGAVRDLAELKSLFEKYVPRITGLSTY
jgi:hypothetical protein